MQTTSDHGAGEVRPADNSLMRWPVFLVVGATFLFWSSLYLYVPVLPLQARALEASSTMGSKGERATAAC